MDLESSETAGQPGTNAPATRSPVSVILHSPSLRFVFAAALLQNAGLSVVVPSLALQLEDLEAEPTMLGYVAAAAPFVSVVSPTLVGYLTQRYSTSTTTPYSMAYLLSLLAFIVGNFAQSLATKPVGLLFARALIGMSSGNVAVGNAHLTRELKNGDERNAVVALFTGTEMLGYITGTAMGGLLSALRFSFLGFSVNGYNAPTMTTAIVGVVLLVTGLRGFARSEVALSAKRGKFVSDEVEGENGANAGQAGTTGGVGRKRLVQGAIIVMYFLIAAMYNAVETTSTPMTHRHFRWGVQENAFLWTCSGIVGTICTLLVGHLPPSVARPSFLITTSLVAVILSPPLVLLGLLADNPEDPWNRYRMVIFWLGFLIFDIGYVVSESTFTVLFSSTVDDDDEREEALLFGIFNSVGWYLGCAVGAVVGNHLYLQDTAALLLGCTVAALAALAILAAFWQAIFSFHEPAMSGKPTPEATMKGSAGSTGAGSMSLSGGVGPGGPAPLQPLPGKAVMGGGNNGASGNGMAAGLGPQPNTDAALRRR